MNRRAWLIGALTTLGGTILSACTKFTTAPSTVQPLRIAEKWAKASQRAVGRRQALAPEFKESEVSRTFRANGTTSPPDLDYNALYLNGFNDWRLVVDGLVEQPLSLTMADLRAMPSRTQITRHDCVEGWSCIGKWTGARLSALLDQAKLKPGAKYLIFHCLDTLDGSATDNTAGKYYESIDLADARHEQTILAYDMNGEPLGIPHGAPLRLRVERQLGYKQAKYISRIEAVSDFKALGLGKGGFWEDRGYEWYAGI